MDTKLKILILDDSLTDIKLIKYEIENYFSDIEIEAVTNRKDFIIKLGKFKPNVVLSDYDLPGFDGLTDLHITHEMYPDLPLIIITGSANEEFGILCLKRGAYDYILKNHLQKIPVAIEEALNRYELIKENKRVYDELRESEKKFRLLAENAQDIIFRYELLPQKGFSFISPSVTKITGYSTDEFYSDPDLAYKIMHPDDKQIFDKVDKGEIKIDELLSFRVFNKDGNLVWLELKAIPIFEGKDKIVAIEGIARDVTERVKLEEEIKESEFKFRTITGLITNYAYSFLVDDQGRMRGEWVSDTFIKVFGWTIQELDARGGWQAAMYYEDLPLWIEHAKRVVSGSSDKLEARMVTKSGEIRWVIDYAVPVFDEKGRVIKIYGAAQDITESKKLQEEIKERQEHFEKLADSTTTAIFVYQGEYFVYANKATERITGYTKDELLKIKFYELVHPDFRELVKERGLKRQKGESVPTNYEFKIITKYGKEKWIDFTGNLISWFGKPAGLGTAYDITPLKNAIESLEKAQQRWMAIFENAPVGILIENSMGTIVNVNKKYEDITGYSREELIGKPIHILASPENKDKVDEHIQRILRGESLDHTVESINKNGSRIYVHLIETKYILPDGSPGILSICEDISEKVLLENEIIEREKKLRTIFETANEGIAIADHNNVLTDVNKKFCEMTGYSREEIIGKNFSKFFLLEEDQKGQEIREQNRRQGIAQQFELRLRRKDNSLIWTRVSATGIFDDGKYLGSFAFFTDITEQKKLEKELKQSEEQFRLIWENSNDGMRLTDEEGKVILVNPAFCEIIGLPKEEIEGKFLSEIYSYNPLRKLEILKKHRERFISGKIKTRFETLVTLHDGRKIWLDVSNSFINVGGKKLLLGIFRDITDKKKLSEELAKSEKLFRNVWENSTDAMILTDKFGNIRLVNDALCKMVELPQDKLIGSPFKIVFHTDIRENIFNIHLAKFSDKQLNTNFEGEAILHNGKKIWIDARFSIIQTDDGELFLAIIRDITERKKLIDDLIKAKEEAEEANRLKSGFISMMSHEIRTPLNVIIGFNTVIRELFDKGDDEEVSRYFEAVENASMRLLDTINKILDISRIEAGEFQLNLVEMDLNKKIQKVVDQLNVLAKNKEIKLDLTLDPTIPVLKLDEYCIDGILVNLINNAIKFSSPGTVVEIKSKNLGDKISFKVRDYGIGMSEEYQKHLFEPFSQEEVGYSRPYEGTGLGLALTKKFVELMNGEIKVWSKKGEGSEFEVIFPLTKN